MKTRKRTGPRVQEDIIDDVLRRVVDAVPGMSDELAQAIARQVRHEWAGDSSRICYIARREHELRSVRNGAIRRDYERGERVEYLSRRYQLSERRILQIVRAGGAEEG